MMTDGTPGDGSDEKAQWGEDFECYDGPEFLEKLLKCGQTLVRNKHIGTTRFYLISRNADAIAAVLRSMNDLLWSVYHMHVVFEIVETRGHRHLVEAKC